MPDVVLGPPIGAGPEGGSLDVVSLGTGGSIVLELTPFVDGPGADLVVFENAFPGWTELGRVEVSEDGEVWQGWTCMVATLEDCAGVSAVLTNPDNEISPFDPEVSGGDGFDLADIGVGVARFVRVVDLGVNDAAAPGAGFDLDAIAALHPAPP
ncbi:MAG TPA: cell surface protein, partial [Myxococcota bacterium]|nr:cell surface protein [Myxococcota bacterium]HMV67376.1 cell surface protein [Myxococcota bacterium]